MKIKFSALVVVFAVLIAFTRPSYGLPMDKVLAVVDGEAITFSDYREFVGVEAGKDNADIVEDSQLKKLIEEKVVLHEAVRKGIGVEDPEVDKVIEDIKNKNMLSQEELEKKLTAEGSGIHRYRKLMKDRIMVTKLIGIEVDARVTITDKEMQDFYDANTMKYLANPESVEIEAIFLRLESGATVTEITDLKRKALRLTAQIKEDGDFEKFLNLYSDGGANDRGGRLGVFNKGTLIPFLDEKIFSMKGGQISDPIWVREGVYIVKLISKFNDSFKQLSEVREEIYSVLRGQKRESLFHKWLTGLWEKASITIN